MYCDLNVTQNSIVEVNLCPQLKVLCWPEMEDYISIQYLETFLPNDPVAMQNFERISFNCDH